MAFIGIVIFLIVVYFTIFKNSNLSIKSLFSSYMNYLSNVTLVYSDSNILVYIADKSGENFIFGLKNTSSQFSLSDISALYEISERHHIHNKILITDYPIDSRSSIYKKVREYQITIWNSVKLKKLIESEYNPDFSDNTTKSSALKTSDTSDDTCTIDEANDPIQDGAFNTHGIFSLLGNKPDHL